MAKPLAGRTKPTRWRRTPRGPNSTCWTCSPTRRERACTSATRWATSPRTSTRATSGSRASTSCTRWVTTPSAFPPSSTRSRRASIPAVTTEQNIARYREQLDKIGFSFDWDREVRTCDPGYYKWTQWAFLEMFSHWYDRSKQQARPVAELTAAFETSGTEGLDAACTTEMHFTAAEWNAKSERREGADPSELPPRLPRRHAWSTGVRSWGLCWPTTKCTTDFRSAAAIRSSRSA